MMLAHSVHDYQVVKRHIHSNRLNGVDNEWLTPEEAKGHQPAIVLLNPDNTVRERLSPERGKWSLPEIRLHRISDKPRRGAI